MARIEFSDRDCTEAPMQGSGTDALFEQGMMYCAGRDVELDLVEAHKWFNIAAIRGNAEARRYRTEIANELSKTEVARAQRLAREWLAVH